MAKTTVVRDYKRIPPEVRVALEGRLNKYAKKYFAGCYLELKISFRGPFAYVGALRNIEQVRLRSRIVKTLIDHTKLCRLRYFGSPTEWLFAFYKYSDEVYEPAFLPGSTSFSGSPEQCFECAAGVYLRDI